MKWVEVAVKSTVEFFRGITLCNRYVNVKCTFPTSPVRNESSLEKLFNIRRVPLMRFLSDL